MCVCVLPTAEQRTAARYQSHFPVDINNTHRIRVTSPSDDLSVAAVRRAFEPQISTAVSHLLIHPLPGATAPSPPGTRRWEVSHAWRWVDRGRRTQCYFGPHIVVTGVSSSPFHPLLSPITTCVFPSLVFGCQPQHSSGTDCVLINLGLCLCPPDKSKSDIHSLSPLFLVSAITIFTSSC